MLRRAILFGLMARGLSAATPAVALPTLARQAEEFEAKARMSVATEHLLQRSYRTPHLGFAIGAAAADPVRSYYIVHEIVSEYTFAALKGDTAGKLLEVREIVERDGLPAQTPAAARKALETNVKAGEQQLRKKILKEFTDLGLVDVATDYASILLAFTGKGQADLDIAPADGEWIGTDPATVFQWQQRSGGALEFRGRKQVVRAMHGRIWLASDGVPLRITATFEHDEPRHHLRDDATVEYVRTAFGPPMPVSVVHRHFVDGTVLTENLYTYSPFRLFGSQSTIRFDTPK
jgi:hypothetical protein